MKKHSTFIKVLLGLVLVIAVFCIVAAFQPPTYRVERTRRIVALPSAVFPQVNTVKNWEVWNPWMEVDPAMKLTYEGPASGVGASYSWKGNKEVGEGRMTITEIRPDELVKFKMEFFEPIAGVSQAEFVFKRQGDETDVVWSMSGEKNFLSKAFCIFVDMDKMIGASFEKGLESLKKTVEAAPKS